MHTMLNSDGPKSQRNAKKLQGISNRMNYFYTKNQKLRSNYRRFLQKLLEYTPKPTLNPLAKGAFEAFNLTDVL